MWTGERSFGRSRGCVSNTCASISIRRYVTFASRACACAVERRARCSGVVGVRVGRAVNSGRVTERFPTGSRRDFGRGVWDFAFVTSTDSRNDGLSSSIKFGPEEFGLSRQPPRTSLPGIWAVGLHHLADLKPRLERDSPRRSLSPRRPNERPSRASRDRGKGERGGLRGVAPRCPPTRASPPPPTAPRTRTRRSMFSPPRRRGLPAVARCWAWTGSRGRSARRTRRRNPRRGSARP